MRYKSCELIEHGISFDANSIHACCKSNELNKEDLSIMQFDNIVDWDEVFNIKRNQRARQKHGDLPFCKSCSELSKNNWDNEDYISYINFNFSGKCGSKCVYCDKKTAKHSKANNYVSNIKELIKSGRFKNTGEITFQGCEPVIYKDFDELLSVFIEQNSKIIISTCATKFSKAIRAGLEKDNGGELILTINVDSALKKTYRKLRKNELFDNVWENITAYNKNLTDKQRRQISVKYTITPGFNDSVSEISEFLNKIKSIDIKNLIFDLEYRYFIGNQIISPHIYMLFDFIENFAKENNINVELLDNALQALKKRKFGKIRNFLDDNFKVQFELYKKENLYKNIDYVNKLYKYKSCKLLEHGISINSDSIQACCLAPDFGKGLLPIVNKYENDLINWNEIFRIKRKQRMRQRSEDLYRCKGCYQLKEGQWDDDDYITHINFDHFSECNSRCVYCDVKKIKPKTKNNVLNAVRELIKSGKFRNNGEITFQGGEPTILKEFEELLKLFIDQNVTIRIHSSGILYSKAIRSGLEKKDGGEIILVISPDAAFKQTYKKIKRVDSFDMVWKNIKRYRRNLPVQRQYLVMVKYIIMPGYNDSIEEIIEFLKKIKHIGIKTLIVDIEHQYLLKNTSLSPHIYILMDYMENFAKENNINYNLYDNAIYAEQTRSFEKINDFDINKIKAEFQKYKNENVDMNKKYIY